MLRWGGVTACRRVSQRDGVGAWEPHILRLMRTEQMHSESSFCFAGKKFATI